MLKPKNIGTWVATDYAKRRVKHHPFRHYFSRFFSSDDHLQCALDSIYGCSLCMNLRHFKTWWPVYGYSTATYVSLTTGDAFAVYGRSLDRKFSDKWVLLMAIEAEISFLWACRLLILMRSHASEEVLADRPKNELCRASESEFVAHFFLSFASSMVVVCQSSPHSKRYCNFHSILLSWSPFAFYTSTL